MTMIINSYKQGDENNISKLFNKVFNKEMSLKYWKWRFADNPNDIIMITLMWEKGELIGHYSASPVKMQIGDKEVLSALSMTTMTHPDYGGKGIFTTLANDLYTYVYEKFDTKAVWGFPNNNSHYGFIKNLKWKDLDLIPQLSVQLENITLTNEISDILMPSENFTFNEQHAKSYQKTIKNFSIKVLKDAAYLNWRYIGNPINNYDVFQFKNDTDIYFAVTKIFPSFSDKNSFEIDIVENSFPSDYSLLLKLLSSIKAYYKVYVINKINTWVPLDDSRHILFERLGFVNSVPLTYFGIRVMDHSLYETYTDKRNWYISMGDSDVY